MHSEVSQWWTGRAIPFLTLIIPRTKWSLPTRHSINHYGIGEIVMGKMEYINLESQNEDVFL
jgi:hypothetical protein